MMALALAWLAGGPVGWLSGCLSELPVVAEPCAKWADPGLFRVSIDQSDDKDRRPYVYVPGTEGPRDIVFLLHGAGMSGPKMEEVSEFQSLAAEAGFVLVYPNGLGWPVRLWNAGPRFGEDGKHDDVLFLDRLADDLIPKVCGGRLITVGFSNGSMMAQRWACEGRTKLDAVAGSSGPLLVDDCDGEPLPIRYYHGTKDPVVPINGGTARGIVYPSVDDSMAIWRKRNLCAAGDGTSTQTGDTVCTEWDCEASTIQCLIDGWPHQWPGGVHSPQTQANATGEIWQWFDEVTAESEASTPLPPAD